MGDRDDSSERRRLVVTGVVQGVGFRPFVVRLASASGVVGWVRNEGAAAVVEAEADGATLDRFEDRLRREAPPLARVDAVVRSGIAPVSDTGFVVVPSVQGPKRAGAAIPTGVGGPDGSGVAIPPDVAACDACRVELFDPTARRYRYPFTACTDCGPRYVLAERLPFDRERSTMAGFSPCSACTAEYADPADRRFHHQAICCAACGPRLVDDRGRSGDEALAATHAALAGGGIVAVQGDGGVHLVVDAAAAGAVARLRERKRRAHRPLAVMVADLAAARALIEVDDEVAAALTSPARPIVLAPRRRGIAASGSDAGRDGMAGAAVVDAVAPGTDLLGVMLAGTPLQHLLLAPVPTATAPPAAATLVPPASSGPACSGPASSGPASSGPASSGPVSSGPASPVTPPPVLVMTSGNRSGEPICRDRIEAGARLAGVADAWLTHDRPLAVPCDDSVVRRLGAGVVPLRRSRGMVPVAVELPVPVAPTLAMGGDLKATVCVAAGRRAWLSQHLGDQGSLEARQAVEATIDRLLTLTGVDPGRVAVDAHPGYASASHGRLLAAAAGVPVVEVLHHHAHLAALATDVGLGPREPMLGIAVDGAGAGPDGTVWGGELLVVGPAGVERVGHLAPMVLPGGDAAVRSPARVALAWLHAAGIDWHEALGPVRALGADERAVLARQLAAGTAGVASTSLGRLFDAAASILDVCHTATYEAQAAIELEALAGAAGDGPGRDPVGAPADGLGARMACRVEGGVIDPAPLLAALVEVALAAPGPSAAAVHTRARAARDFHRAVVEALATAAAELCAQRGLGRVGLTGGVLQNALVAAWLPERLARGGLEVCTHRSVPPGDGGLSLGQAVLAGSGAVGAGIAGAEALVAAAGGHGNGGSEGGTAAGGPD